MIIKINKKNINIKQVGIVGWAGRNRKIVQAHIDELSEIGVEPPSQVPLVYAITPSILTQETNVHFVGEQHSGEAEVCLISDEEQALWVSIASDHTDRQLETYDVAWSKQVCAKPIAHEAWAYDEVIHHWDELQLFSYIKENDSQPFTLYQKGQINSLLHVNDVIAQLPKDLQYNNTLKPSTLILCGTLPVVGTINCQAKIYRMVLNDSILNREISLHYHLTNLPRRC